MTINLETDANTLNSTLIALYEVRQQKATLDKTEKQLLSELKPMVDPAFDQYGKEAKMGTSDGLVLTRIEGTSRNISSELLLERGVAPDVIAYATKTTTYYQYRIRDMKEVKE